MLAMLASMRVIACPSAVICWPCCDTALLSTWTVDASALVATLVSASWAAAAASVATLSVTADQALPFQRLGVLALPVVSIHRFCVRRSATAGVDDWYSTLPLAPAASEAACAACCALVTFWLVVSSLPPS